MCAPLDHLPFPEDKDPGSLSDRDEVVRNDDRRPPAHQTAQWLKDPMAGLGVEVGGRLVQDEARCVANHRPRNGDPLALTAGEAPALLANNRIVPVGEPSDELMSVGGFGRADDLLYVRVRPSKGDDLATYRIQGQRPLDEDRD